MSLHDPVGVVAREARVDEGEQQPLAEEEAAASLEVLAHLLGTDDEALDEPGEAVEHVVEREERVGNDDALGRGVGDVALVPEGDVLEPDERGGTDDAREPADSFGDDRVPLVRHRGGSLLALAERLLHLGDLGPREVADLDGEALQRRCADRERGEQLRVTVALDDLGRRRLGLEAEPLAGNSLDLRVDRRVVADSARQLADSHAFERLLDTSPRAVELERPDGELEAERRRLRVDAVCSADRQREPVLLGPGNHGGERATDAFEDQLACGP